LGVSEVSYPLHEQRSGVTDRERAR
jgi:hypothetical protein